MALAVSFVLLTSPVISVSAQTPSPGNPKPDVGYVEINPQIQVYKDTEPMISLIDKARQKSVNGKELATSCLVVTPKNRIKVFAQLLLTNEAESDMATKCLHLLSQDDMAAVADEVAKELGVYDAYQKEMLSLKSEITKSESHLGNTQINAFPPDGSSYNCNLPNWCQGITNYTLAWNAFWGERHNPYTYFIDYGYLCPTGRGTEYAFAHYFNSAVSNPNGLWASTVDNTVYPFLVGYMMKGGYKILGNVYSNYVYTCAGDTTISILGAWRWANTVWLSR